MGLTMLGNGLDFVINSIIHLKEAEQESCKSKEKEIKYSLLHLSSGIELILKSRLYREHWTYIFSDMNKANKENLKNGSFKSVESAILIDRLKILCGIDIDNDSKNAFENLRKLRNQMEHFTINDNFPAVEACINKALVEVSKFITNNYNDFTSPLTMSFKDDDDEFGLTQEEEKLIEELIKYIAKLKEHYDDAIKIATVKAQDEAVLHELLKCPSCKEKLLKCNYDDNMCHCFFCTYEEKGETVAEEYLNEIQGLSQYEIVKDGGKYPLYKCPDCDRNSMVNVGGKYVCFSCGMYYRENEVAFCDKCSVLYIKEDDNSELCHSCAKYKVVENK
ncbi:hypothetical protein [Clostridium saccharobutylicum]|uniref:Uncharacterized protein n=1 Tax=Clostridium saccharobutylicum TaxID=169679 RepID=A0A1S8N3L9_CLOSA|nr:hypothetical protein [Clostridium saccharobutylicum]OOM11005.1 hypothetical protein CLOSAC_25330 [Clostridium saccharobutylicum]